jgi:glycosyltransferase involved in cell wall biosynthesis
MKKIAIDCRVLAWKHSGIARYLDNILLQLAELDKTGQYFLLSPVPLPSLYKRKNMTPITLSHNDLVYKFFAIPQYLKKEKIDVFWSPTHDLPLIKMSNCKYIATIHDVAFEHDISPYGWKVRVLHDLGLYKRSAKIADVILTDSQFSKEDIVKTYHLDSQKIIVTYLGADERFKEINKDKAKAYVAKRFGLDQAYIFYVNTGRPKNLLEAFHLLKENEWKKTEVKLVCLGKSVNQEEDISFLAKGLSLNNDILFIQEFVSDEDLNNLYAGAAFFVCPSYFEGFGLTPLEAMKSGTPILISNVTALPEIFQDAAMYCNPKSVEDIRKKMKIQYDMKKKKRDILKNREDLLKKYTWESVAQQVFEELSR